jgi:hypothetical protein
MRHAGESIFERRQVGHVSLDPFNAVCYILHEGHGAVLPAQGPYRIAFQHKLP